MSNAPIASSFRDPSGFLFYRDGKIFRQINHAYQADYEHLVDSGLYDSLVAKGLLIPHAEVAGASDDCFKIIEPELIRYISYPYEWSFSQLRDAAKLTLDVQVEALRFGMTLKDASAYNVQFHKGKPVFIDTLSFEIYRDGNAWIAYRQFCQHFVAPLALIVHCDQRLANLFLAFIDGIPLDLASRLLPLKSWFKYHLIAHIHLHAKSQMRFQDVGRAGQPRPATPVSRRQLDGLLASLSAMITSLKRKTGGTTWSDYYTDTNYDDSSMQHKEAVVADFLDQCKDDTVEQSLADFGANTGRFSRLAASKGYFVIAYDIDEMAVDRNYLQVIAEAEQSILPLVLNLMNPSPAIGWANTERSSFAQRQNARVGMALALIHHIVISNNVPLGAFAGYLATLCRFLIIEFVPKEDSQVQRLLATRKDIFADYTQAEFEKAFGKHYKILASVAIENSVRTVYLMRLL